MTEGPLGGAAFNNEFGRPNLAGYFREYEQAVAGVQRGYHKPIMIAGGLGSHRRRPDPQAAVRRRHAAGAAGRAGHAHRHGRRRRQLDGRRHQHRGARLRQWCSAATPRSSAARRRSSTTAGRWARTTRSSPSTTSAPAASATPSPNWWTAPAAGATFDLRKVPLEESGPGAEGDLVQREPGALHAGRQPRPDAAVRADVRARALPLRGGRRRHRGARSGARGRPRRRARDRHADGGAARQAAEDAPRRAACRARCHRWT